MSPFLHLFFFQLNFNHISDIMSMFGVDFTIMFSLDFIILFNVIESYFKRRFVIRFHNPFEIMFFCDLFHDFVYLLDRDINFQSFLTLLA